MTEERGRSRPGPASEQNQDAMQLLQEKAWEPCLDSMAFRPYLLVYTCHTCDMVMDMAHGHAKSSAHIRDRVLGFTFSFTEFSRCAYSLQLHIPAWTWCLDLGGVWRPFTDFTHHSSLITDDICTHMDSDIQFQTFAHMKLDTRKPAASPHTPEDLQNTAEEISQMLPLWRLWILLGGA